MEVICFPCTIIFFIGRKSNTDIEGYVNIRRKDKLAPLHVAAQMGHLEVIKLLLLNGALFQSTDKSCPGTLHVSAGRGHIDVMKILVSKGADIEDMDDNLDTALHWYVRFTPLYYYTLASKVHLLDTRQVAIFDISLER